MILINVDYTNWTPDDSDEGGTYDNGCLYQDEPISFRTLVELMRGYDSASSYPADENCWLSALTTDFKTGIETIHNIHFSAKNKSRYKKYWVMALKVAGFK